ncbi:MAG: NADP-dependent isocitrate dehydrogenase, partial [Nocardioidaceae bacterium]
IDNRGSHFYLALFWAEELASQSEDAELAAAYDEVAAALRTAEDTINEELLGVQGSPADIGGYFRPDDALAEAVMRPSTTLNDIVSALDARLGG